MSDLSNLIPPALPSDDRIDHAVEILGRLTEVEGLDGWVATFRRDNLECTGVYPGRDDNPALADFYVPVELFMVDNADPEGSWQRDLARCRLARCRLAIKHGIERHDLELDLMREAIEQSEAR